MADYKLKTVQPRKMSKETYAAPYIETVTPHGVYLGNAHIDNLMQIVYSLGTEIWIDRQRNFIVHSLLAQKKEVTTEAIEQYIPTDAEKTLWQAEQDALVKRVYAVLARETAGVRPFGTKRPLTQADQM